MPLAMTVKVSRLFCRVNRNYTSIWVNYSGWDSSDCLVRASNGTITAAFDLTSSTTANYCCRHTSDVSVVSASVISRPSKEKRKKIKLALWRLLYSNSDICLESVDKMAPKLGRGSPFISAPSPQCIKFSCD